MALRKWHRREMFALCCVAAVGVLGPAPARALESDAAKAHVGATIEQIFALIQANKPRAETAKRLREIFEESTALPQLARFCTGHYWKDMSPDERDRFTESFSEYLAYVYAGYFREFHGDIADLRAAVAVTGAKDVGAKGILVKSEVRPVQQAAISIDWLISDRSGKIAISDLLVEGISLAITQREIIIGMFESRGGDAARLISDLNDVSLRSGS
jgi:phospholipid transport system substrate-binding protein